MANYYVILDPEVNIEVFGSDTPFNLKKDIKNLQKETVERIVGEIGASLEQKLKVSVLYESRVNNLTVSCIKMRIIDDNNNKGKSSGFRCIVIVDEIRKWCIVLHIFKKSDKLNISNDENNKLKKLFNKYVKSLKD